MGAQIGSDMKRLKLMSLLVVWLAYACRPNEPTVERSVGKTQTAIASYLSAHLVEMRNGSAQVSVVTDGKLGIFAEGEKWTNKFILRKGDRFQTQSDHHAYFFFEIERLNPASVSIRYSSTFDHRSFGKNLITIDEGEVELPIK
jgi:hypothetical protein